MAKRSVLVFFGVLVATAGFAAGWLARTPSTPPSEPDTVSPRGSDSVTPTPLAAEPTVTPENTIAFWCYKRGPFGTSISLSGGTYLCNFIAHDDITTVADWYGKKLGAPFAVEQTSDRKFGRQGRNAVTYGDSFLPGSEKPRGVKVGVGMWYSKTTVVSVTLTQTEGEKYTHVVVIMLTPDGQRLAPGP